MELEDENENEDEDEDEVSFPSVYEDQLNQRFDDLTSKNSIFDKNLLDKNTMKILFNHNFYSFPSDYYESDNYQDFEDRKHDVNRLLNSYYNKIKDLADFDTIENIYSIAKIKDGIRNRTLKKLIKNEIKNFNALSIYTGTAQREGLGGL